MTVTNASLARLALAATSVVLLATSSHADPVKCQRAIAKAASQLAQAEMSALAKCGQAKIKGTLPPSTECATETKTAGALDKARAKLRTAVAKACGGGNESCAATDTGADADDSLAAIGWDVGACPGFESVPCTNAIADCGDVATCVTCVTDAAVAQATALSFDAVEPSMPGSDLNKCQVAIGKESAKLFTTQAKTLVKCEDEVLKGKIAGPCPDAATHVAIDGATLQSADRVCTACGGGDKACGGSDDLAPAAIGFAASCPAVTVPGGSTCGGPIEALSDLVACVDCVNSFENACLDALAVPALKAYPVACGQLPTPTPTATATPTPTPTPSATPPAGPAAIRCQRTLAKETSRLVQTKIKKLADCERAKLAGKLPEATDCPSDPGVAAALAKATGRLTAQIGKSCGGANAACSAADTGGDADLPLSDMGWFVPACPNFENGACSGPVADCGDVAGCIGCVTDAAVAQAVAAYFGATPADPSTEDGKCEIGVGKAAASYYLARAGALATCAGTVLAKGGTATCPDAKANAAIAKAETKLVKAMCKACGGADGLCGGGDDLVPSQLGFPATCPDVDVPGGDACGGPVATLDDLVACVACLTAFKSECTDRIAIPNLRGYAPECNLQANGPTPTPTAGGATPQPTPTPVCGNGVKETGEDCDDGNTVNCDACPKDCKTSHAPVQCAATTLRHAQPIHLVPPPGALLSAGVFCIDYPAGVVALPGTGNVSGRVSGINAITSLNDFNDAVQFGFVASPGFTDATPVISFDLCSGAADPPPTDFSCVVKSASNQGDSIDPPSLVECTPVTP